MPTSFKNLDIKDVFEKENVQFKSESIFLTVGNASPEAQEIFYISISPAFLIDFLPYYISLAHKRQINYQIVSTLANALDVVDGVYGITTVGKTITIYFYDFVDLPFIKNVIQACQTYSGPDIPGTYKIDNCVYSNLKTKFSVTDFPNMAEVQVSRIDFGHNYQNTAIFSERPKGNILTSTLILPDKSKQSVFIKEGKKCMWRDKSGRTIIDRIKWEGNLLKQLQSIVKVPILFDEFCIDGNEYIVLEKIEGSTFTDFIKKLNKNYEAWRYWKYSDQTKALTTFRSIILILNKLFINGYIHRDISSENFIVGKNGEVTLIDTESIVDLNEHLPEPPFETGTKGFSSPAVFDNLMPSLNDHIYSIGKLALFLSTTIHPLYFDQYSSDKLAWHLEKFIGRHEIGHFIISCLDYPNEYTHDRLISEIDKIINEQTNVNNLGKVDKFHPNRDSLHSVIKSDLSTIDLKNILSFDLGQLNFLKSNESSSDLGWHNGVLGLVHTFIKAHNHSGLLTNANESKIINEFLTNIMEFHMDKINDCKVGLKDGVYSLLYTCAKAMGVSILKSNDMFTDFFQRVVWLKPNNTSYNYGSLGIVPSLLITSEAPFEPQIREISKALLYNLYQNLAINFENIVKDNDQSNFILENYLAILQIKSSIDIPYSHHIFRSITNNINTLTNSLQREIQIEGLNNHNKANYNRLIKYLTVASAGSGAMLPIILEEIKDTLPNFLVLNNPSRFNGLAFFGNIFLQSLKTNHSEEIHKRLLNILACLESMRMGSSQGTTWYLPNKTERFFGFDNGNSGILDFYLEVIDSNVHLN
ncbi:protein kinase domain-containing protein [Chitinophaga barathri]|uniref:Protein kinase domain-containing protein n=1 Tax=Chitinophaga barathri TaxID=1647451 RepID=A0A3N4MSJ2_9BACT|nr:serine/threonine-protein kinase [Chitinophaga barathri]RPD43110.1 hypothetical protein EG028_02110 [Chitinophaga barathri]